jgi:hypothetical protein
MNEFPENRENNREFSKSEAVASIPPDSATKIYNIVIQAFVNHWLFSFGCLLIYQIQINRCAVLTREGWIPTVNQGR